MKYGVAIMRISSLIFGITVCMVKPFDCAYASDLDEADLAARIDRLRRVDAVVPVPAGVTGRVRYELVRHAFAFGTAINAQALGIPLAPREGKKPRTEIAGEDQRRYQDTLNRYFHAAVAENEMKWYFMEAQDGVAQDKPGLSMLEWCRARQIPMRGHCIFWGIDKHVQGWLRALPPDTLEARMRQRLGHVLDVYRGTISEWDLNNEMMHGDYYGRTLGWTNGVRYFEWASKAAPEVRFFVNDFGVLQSGTAAAYVKHIRELRAAGANIGGIGDQAHFYRPLPENKVLWGILDQLGAFGLPVVITEYDQSWKGMTEEEQGLALRRFVSLCYAHPAVDGIYLWGFWEGRHWRRECALWRKDWSIKPNGQAWVDLMTREWHTAGDAEVVEGALRFRGFPGRYRLQWQGGECETVVPKAGTAIKQP